jgi:hypothetical protein
MGEKKTKSAVGKRLYGAHRCLERPFGAGTLVGLQLSVKMGLDRGMAGAERALLLRSGPAHGAAHR